MWYEKVIIQNYIQLDAISILYYLRLEGKTNKNTMEEKNISLPV